MFVSQAAVDEDSDALPREDDVRAAPLQAGEGVVNPVPETCRVKQPPHGHFRFRIATLLLGEAFARRLIHADHLLLGRIATRRSVCRTRLIRPELPLSL